MEKKSSPKRGTVRPRSSRTQYKNKPLKVVYISNPMKVVATASGFRALVQQLTGKDASDVPPPPPTSDGASSSSSSSLSSPTSHVMDSPGVEVEFPAAAAAAAAAHPSPDDAFSCDLFFQPLGPDETDDDRVLFIDRRHMVMFDDHDFTGIFPSHICNSIHQ